MNMAEAETDVKSLYLERVFDSPRDRIFKAWTDPVLLKQWFAPQDVSTETVEVDLQVGGRYKIIMKLPDGELAHHYGTYREICPPEKLVFTWILDGEGCEGQKAEQTETLVTVEFKLLGEQTQVCLTHDLFSTEKSRDMHGYGWNGCLDSLARLSV